MKQFGAESLENREVEVPTLEAEFERLKEIMNTLKNIKLTLTKDAEKIEKEDLLDPDFDIALIKEGSEGMHVSFNSKSGLIIRYVNEWADYLDYFDNPSNANNTKNITPHIINKELKMKGLDKPQKQSEISVNYMA